MGAQLCLQRAPGSSPPPCPAALGPQAAIRSQHLAEPTPAGGVLLPTPPAASAAQASASPMRCHWPPHRGSTWRKGLPGPLVPSPALPVPLQAVQARSAGLQDGGKAQRPRVPPGPYHLRPTLRETEPQPRAQQVLGKGRGHLGEASLPASRSSAHHSHSLTLLTHTCTLPHTLLTHPHTPFYILLTHTLLTHTSHIQPTCTLTSSSTFAYTHVHSHRLSHTFPLAHTCARGCTYIHTCTPH